MSGYQDRALRVDVRFALEFITDGKRVRGTCENLSESGLLAKFTVQLELWVDGEVDLHFGTHLLGVKVRVARVVGLQVGMAFQYSDEHQRQKIRDLISSAHKEGVLPEHLHTTSSV